MVALRVANPVWNTFGCVLESKSARSRMVGIVGDFIAILSLRSTTLKTMPVVTRPHQERHRVSRSVSCFSPGFVEQAGPHGSTEEALRACSKGWRVQRETDPPG